MRIVNIVYISKEKRYYISILISLLTFSRKISKYHFLGFFSHSGDTCETWECYGIFSLSPVKLITLKSYLLDNSPGQDINSSQVHRLYAFSSYKPIEQGVWLQ